MLLTQANEDMKNHDHAIPEEEANAFISIITGLFETVNMSMAEAISMNQVQVH